MSCDEEDHFYSILTIRPLDDQYSAIDECRQIMKRAKTDALLNKLGSLHDYVISITATTMKQLIIFQSIQVLLIVHPGERLTGILATSVMMKMTRNGCPCHGLYSQAFHKMTAVVKKKTKIKKQKETTRNMFRLRENIF